MPGPRRRVRPAVEALDGRLVPSSAASSLAAQAIPVPRPPSPIITGRYPVADAGRPFTPADLQAYARSYLSFVGGPGFTPQYDFNGTGTIGQNDATPILRGLRGVTPRIPLQLTLRLAPGQQVVGHHPSNSGPVTRLGTVTVIGRTTPNSIVFVDGPTEGNQSQSTGNFKFAGGALAADAQGEFSYTVRLTPNSRGGSLLATNFLIRTPFDQQLIRSYPIRRLP